MSAIRKAIEENDIENVKELIRNNLAEVLKEKDTLLHLATEYNADLEIFEALVKTLKEAKADVNVKNNLGYSPLHLALRNGAGIETINILLKAGTRINAVGKDKNTPLHIALKNGADIEIIKTLLDAGADITAKNKFDITPLKYAFIKQDVEKSKVLLKKGINNTKITQDFLNISLRDALSKIHDIEIIQELISLGADVNAKIHVNSSSMLETALKYPVLSSFLDDSPFNHDNSNIEVIEALINAGAKVGKVDNLEGTLLH